MHNRLAKLELTGEDVLRLKYPDLSITRLVSKRFRVRCKLVDWSEKLAQTNESRVAVERKSFAPNKLSELILSH
jgi:hypothetical protein